MGLDIFDLSYGKIRAKGKIVRKLRKLLPITCFLVTCLSLKLLSPLSNLAAEIPDSVTNSPAILADNPYLNYSGRLDWQDPQAPSFGFPGTSVQFQFRGTSLQIELSEDNWNSGNFIDVFVDDNPTPTTIKLEVDPLGKPIIYDLAANLTDEVHRVKIIKRNDYITGEFKFHRLITDGELMPAMPKSSRTIEVYGDSISAASIVEYPEAGMPDPEDKSTHNALSNAYWSYGSILARNYDAEVSLVAQSGASLVDGFGFWHNGTGMSAFYNKVKPLDEASPWNFANFTPDLVIIALGQNDSATIAIGKDMSAEDWKGHYKQLITNLRAKYPNAYFIGMFPNMYHDRTWDDYLTDAIAEYSSQSGDQRIFSLIHEQVTPGHPRISEQQQMADTLKQFIDGTLTENGFSWDS